MKLDVKFVETTTEFKVSFGEVYNLSANETYNGVYEVTPETEEQILETANKAMVKNVTINAVPYAEVSNNSGGKTITIGGN